MRRISVLIILPIVIFALERVNLIKNHSFEMDSEVWGSRVYGSAFPYVAEVNCRDPENVFRGNYSGSGETRTEPPNLIGVHEEYAIINQEISVEVVLEDIDSLFVSYSTFALRDDLYRTYFTVILLHINANKEDYKKVGYGLKHPDYTLNPPPNWNMRILSQNNFPDDSFWHIIEKDIRKDIQEISLYPPEATVDSIDIRVIGGNGGESDWRGQKVFFDDVRLMGYADYDVGIKNILSGDGGSPYTPSAHIKNFGREPADFQVFAEILQGETQLYIDSLDWSLPSDTDDTVSFRTFTPPDTGTYTLRIYTFMDPDESDADDELSKELHFSAIAEPPETHPQHLTLDVKPMTSGDVKVSYSLPNGHKGTLTLFDASGRRVVAKRVRGYGSVEFNAELTAGVYVVRLEVGSSTLTRKVVVVE